MDCDSNEFRDLIHHACDGSEDAAWELVEQYGEAIRRAVRRALNPKLRSKFDSLDFVQVVWSSFFRQRDKLHRFETPEQLVAFLVVMARNKVGMEARRRFLTEKYNVNKERPLEEKQVHHSVGLEDHKPGPLDVAIARERWNELLRDQPEHYRKIIQLRLQGHTCQGIADTLQVAESTVRRFLKRLSRETDAS